MPDYTKFRFSIDRGGTFTDVYAELPGKGRVRMLKLLSEDPLHYEDGPREGIRRIFSEYDQRPVADHEIDSSRIEWIRMGTTVATNALLERKGADFALVTTRGFADLLSIGNQSRPDLFDLQIRKPELLYQAVVEVDERVRPLQAGQVDSGLRQVKATSGSTYVIEKQPDSETVRQQLQAVYDQGIRHLAVVFLHGYAFPDHERQVQQIAEQIGFCYVSASHAVMPMIKMVPRGDTTAVDAYLTPHIQEYLQRFSAGFADGLKQTPVLFMQSSGGLTDAVDFRGSNAILSGPAGGVVGYARTTCSQTERLPVIGFDMGGTSTDVSRFDGTYELAQEAETAGVRIQAPQMQIKTVAAGGGSRLFFRNRMLAVGPDSVGADPGPVCYRKGGSLSVTDANLLLGRIQPDDFPKIFGPAANQPLDREQVVREFGKLTTHINTEYGYAEDQAKTPEAVAMGFIKVANEVMVRAIREISVMRGFDVQEHILACFGGAGGQHACAIARELGIQTIHIHRYSGILSAYGMGMADVVTECREPCAMVYGPSTREELDRRLADLEARTISSLLQKGYPVSTVQTTRYLNLRYQGTDTALMVPAKAGQACESDFRNRYFREFGFDLEDRFIRVDDLRVRAEARMPGTKPVPISCTTGEPRPRSIVSCYFEDCFQDTPVYNVADLSAGHRMEGPAILLQDTATILVEPGCRAKITDYGDIRIQVGRVYPKPIPSEMDPVRLAVFSNRFMSIAEQMGRTLQKTAISTNIKERLDFSCAIFDEQGNLVSNAPHIPVHLGAMAACVRHQIRCKGRTLQPGDAILTNHPAMGGSHLPDLTVISPVFIKGRICFYVACRGHHADIGGITPGSMPPFSTSLEEEGVCIDSFKLVRAGRFEEPGITRLLAHPQCGASGRPGIGSRRLSDNLSDLKAQVAANKRGIDLLEDMTRQYSLSVVQAYMGHIQQAAEWAVRDLLKAMPARLGLEPGATLTATDFLDDGTPLVLDLSIDSEVGAAVLDFSQSGDQVPGNLNAPEAVTWSAVLYCLRCLVDQPIPLNQGCLHSVRILLRKGSLLSPSADAAVVGGNVLTSQRVVDVIFKAFSAAAASQGCMNNITFGDDSFGYYETIGGGAGAGPSWAGQSGVHTHMTNTRITDPEILETRYPVVLERFSVRRNSGGKGRYRGGDGLVRIYRFLKKLDVAVLTERRVLAPYGLTGGDSGKRGRNLLLRRDGRVVDLGGKNQFRSENGDRLIIRTPGGGGYGPFI